MVLVVTGALRTATPKLGEWHQQIPGATTEISVHKSAVTGTAQILCRTLKVQGPREGLELEGQKKTARTSVDFFVCVYIDKWNKWKKDIFKKKELRESELHSASSIS